MLKESDIELAFPVGTEIWGKKITMSCPTYGYWYQRFSVGLHKRMGDVVKSDYAVTSEIVKELLEQLDSEWEVASCDSERKRIADMGLVIAAGFLCGLRGEEIMKVDLGGLMKYLDPGRDHATCPHLIVALLGRLKGETGERYHMMVMSRVSRSGIVGGIWADRVVEVNRRNGRTKGYVFTYPGAKSSVVFGRIEWWRSIGGTVGLRVMSSRIQERNHRWYLGG